MRTKILLSLFVAFVSCIQATFALPSLPFTDVPTQASWYADLQFMYDAGVIGDTKDHLFRPEGLLPRDEFVGIVVGVGCRKCVYPTPEDIQKYTADPFIDIAKKNPYFYCISYAREQKIVQWYTLDTNGQTQCQDKTVFTSVPFCPVNSISRIEAAAVLLRQANLWNETLNSAFFVKKHVIADVDAYWYGYAEKAIEAGLIKKGRDNKIAPNEYITRREFVIMAAKIFHMNLCQIKPVKKNDFSSTMFIFDKEKRSCPSNIPETVFPNLLETTYDFKGYGVSSGDLSYDWEFFNTTTGEKKYASGACLDNYDLVTAGVWMVRLRVSDDLGNASVSYRQVVVNKLKELSVRIQGKPIDGYAPLPVQFSSLVTGGQCAVEYLWDFGDGSYASEPYPQHTYLRIGVYTVTLTARDTCTGIIWFAQLVVHVVKDPDPDKDWVPDFTDRCLNIFDECPDPIDRCPDVFGEERYFGCPAVPEYTGPIDPLNKCLSDRIVSLGSIQGWVQCLSCPCAYAVDFVSQIRRCDIIFPSILSPDGKSLYSRGSVYQIDY